MNDNNALIEKLVSKLIVCLKTYKKKVGFFDLETQKLFKDIEPKWDNFRFKEKESLRPKVIPQMKISISGILSIDKSNKPLYTYYEEDEVDKLINHLSILDKIIGHNLLRFDYDVISAYVSESILQEFKAKTIDTWRLLKEKTNQWIGLDDLGKLNFGISKTIDTLQIPKMWKEGKQNEVKKYLKRDLDILALVFYNGLNQLPIKYYKKSYGKVLGTKSVNVNWQQLVK